MSLDEARAVAQRLREYHFNMHDKAADTIDALIAEVEAAQAEVRLIWQPKVDAFRAENERLREALQRIADSRIDFAGAAKALARDTLLPHVPETNFGNIPDKRKKCVKCGNDLMSDFTSTCYACDHQVPDERDNLLNGG